LQDSIYNQIHLFNSIQNATPQQLRELGRVWEWAWIPMSLCASIQFYKLKKSKRQLHNGNCITHTKHTY